MRNDSTNVGSIHFQLEVHLCEECRESIVTYQSKKCRPVIYKRCSECAAKRWLGIAPERKLH